MIGDEAFNNLENMVRAHGLAEVLEALATFSGQTARNYFKAFGGGAPEWSPDSTQAEWRNAEQEIRQILESIRV